MSNDEIRMAFKRVFGNVNLKDLPQEDPLKKDIKLFLMSKTDKQSLYRLFIKILQTKMSTSNYRERREFSAYMQGLTDSRDILKNLLEGSINETQNPNDVK